MKPNTDNTEHCSDPLARVMAKIETKRVEFVDGPLPEHLQKQLETWNSSIHKDAIMDGGL